MAVVIPCYRVTGNILSVLSSIPPWVALIICVDDCCPDGSGPFIVREFHDPRVRMVRNDQNLGVGGATVRGYREALLLGADIIAKIDGDGQMDPSLLPYFLGPIQMGLADYTKGNRFYRPESLQTMPFVRLFGNAVLSLFCKFSTGYWNIVDPTNGYTAIHATVLRLLPLGKISNRYFFESDMLFRLGTIKAVVVDIPMDGVYENEVSNLSVRRQIAPFLRGHIVNFFKRFAYCYLARDFNLASILVLTGLPLILVGISFGVVEWALSISSGKPATAGTVMAAALPIIVGLQLLLSAIGYDFANVPRRPIHQGFARVTWDRTLRSSCHGDTPSACNQPLRTEVNEHTSAATLSTDPKSDQQ